MDLTYDFKNTDLLSRMDELARIVKNTEPATKAMAEIVQNALIQAAPFDAKNTKWPHLKEVIKTSKVNITKNGKQEAIWVSSRGIKKPDGPKARKKWNKDKQIYKLVVAEYGRSNLPARPFWSPTVDRVSERAIRKAIEVMEHDL